MNRIQTLPLFLQDEYSTKRKIRQGISGAFVQKDAQSVMVDFGGEDMSSK